MTQDRRDKFRKAPDKFVFLQLERDDGGTVLDISEGGLRFEAFAPVNEDGAVHFWFSLNLRDRIEAWGELVWINAAKKSGGLRFLHLTEEDRAQIREWISQPSSQEAPDEEFSRWAVATDTPARMGASEPDAVAKFVSKARRQHATFMSGAESAGVSSTLFPILRKEEPSGELVPMQRYLSAKRRQLILGLLLGIGISATVAVAAIKYSNYRHQNEGLGKAPTELSAQKSGGESLPSVPMSPTAASAASANIISIGKQKNVVARDHTPSYQVAATGGNSQRHLNGNESQRKTSRTPEELWNSVHSGNSKAAVELAELYIKGEGVPQNCTQARVLLLAASEKRNVQAIKRLQELDKTGCPLDQGPS
jgi:PilZ domain